MQSLLAASEQRTTHEITTHNYNHVKIEDTPPNYAKGPLKVRRVDYI
jgi:hypothetical protein